MRGDENIEAQIRKARRGTAVAQGGNQTQREIGRYIERALGQTLRDFQIIKEKVERLNGERGKTDLQAVLRRDFFTPDMTDVYQRGNIIGSVSKVDGVPTGALFEEGSNDDGEYFIRADGLAYTQTILSIDMSQTYGNESFPIPLPLTSSIGTIPGYVSGSYGGGGTGESDVFAAGTTVKQNPAGDNFRLSMRDTDRTSSSASNYLAVIFIGKVDL